eukprot:CAMPEP_0183437720 /NCGR_PEP_ID=MMETSP0370-20130417/74314_1 /TAXON_ID=268820 /ORGANISM="Peridinium aciculiferum, Strain PAER-2" /LENGTH=35 /DNA_ID= /DNA_START= /DNA_END= /DNA_ORIENTATION=
MRFLLSLGEHVAMAAQVASALMIFQLNKIDTRVTE